METADSTLIGLLYAKNVPLLRGYRGTSLNAFAELSKCTLYLVYIFHDM